MNSSTQEPIEQQASEIFVETKDNNDQKSKGIIKWLRNYLMAMIPEGLNPRKYYNAPETEYRILVSAWQESEPEDKSIVPHHGMRMINEQVDFTKTSLWRIYAYPNLP